MYTLPVNFDEKRFVGRYLETVSIGAFVTNLIFSMPHNLLGSSNVIGVSIKGECSFIIDGKLFVGNAENPESMTPLIKMLMRNVIAMNRLSEFSLQFIIDHGYELILDAENSPEFESYCIYIHGEDMITV